MLFVFMLFLSRGLDVLDLFSKYPGCNGVYTVAQYGLLEFRNSLRICTCLGY